MFFRVILVALLLAVSPWAQAVECVMAAPVAAHAGCPMAQAAEPQPHTLMTVADCFELSAVAAEAMASLPDVPPVPMPAIQPLAVTLGNTWRQKAFQPPPRAPPVVAGRAVLLWVGRLLL